MPVRFARWLLLGWALVACASEPRVLRIGTSGDYSPFSLDGEGFDVEVAELLAEDLEARIAWVRFRWPELANDVAENRFDIAMSGITWRPDRAVVGHMTRAVASGGACVLGDPQPDRVAVNRGGILERWARARFPQAEIQAVTDNRSLPDRLARGEADAIVTDSFELRHFRRPGFAERCEPARERKVYWIAPGAAPELGPEVERFLRAREPRIDALREHYFGARAPHGEVDHLVDLIARRLAYMPAVAAWKRSRGQAIADPSREERVLARTVERATTAGLEPAGARRLFALQIELARAVQERASPEAATLDLERELRPELLRLGDRIIASLARAAPLAASELDSAGLALLEPLLAPTETERVRRALLDVRRAD